MRIRKNTKLSPLLFTCSSSLLQNGSFPVENFQSHVCQLNQSTWDVIPFASNNSSIHQFEEQNIFTNGDSFGALDESVDSLMETEVVDVDNNKPAIEDFEMMVVDDNKVVDNNGGSNKGLKRNSNGGDGIKAPRRGRGRPKKSLVGSASRSNNNEFYYYSGFGPSWRKQRKGDSKNEGEDNNTVLELGSTSGNVKVNVGNNNVVASVDVNVGNNNVVADVDVNVVPCSVRSDYVEDDYDDYGDNDNGKSRMRKPVKERSLKSLM